MGFMSHLYFSALQHPYDLAWMSVGYAGQLVFGIRFLIQGFVAVMVGVAALVFSVFYAFRPEQVSENVKAAGVRLEPALLEEIDRVLGDVIERDPAKTQSPAKRDF